MYIDIEIALPHTGLDVIGSPPDQVKYSGLTHALALAPSLSSSYMH